MQTNSAPTVYNFADDFEEYWEQNKTQPDEVKLAKLKSTVFMKFHEFYNWKIEKWKKSGYDPDKKILEVLRRYEPLRPQFIEKTENIDRDIEANLPSFLKAFPDFKSDEVDVYVIHSFGEMDGGTRKINDKVYFIFGIDGVVNYHQGMKTDVPFFHHELFHVYHRQYLVDKDTFWVALWAEGLATYVSEVLNPGASTKDIMLDTPSGMHAACNKAKSYLLQDIESKLGSENEDDYETYFLVSSKDKNIPKRAGYCVGYWIAKKIGERYSVQDMAKFSEAKIRKEMHTALRELRSSEGR